MTKNSYVNVPNDLSKVKTKLAFNLTKPQLVCFGIAAAVGVPLLPAGPQLHRQHRGHVPYDGGGAPRVFAGYV